MRRIMGDEQVANRELKPQTTTTTAVKTSLKKLICLLTNFIAFIWTRSIRQIQTTFPGVEFFSIYPDSKQGRNIRRRMFTSSIKRRIRLHVILVQWTSKKCT